MARHEHFDLTEDEQEEIAALHRAGESALSIARHLSVPAADVAEYIEYYDLRQIKKAADRASGAAFVLGLLALLFAGLPLPFWPGILFVIGLSSLIRAFARLHRASHAQTAIWTFGLGLMFMPGVSFSFGGILVLFVFAMIASTLFKDRFDHIDEDQDEDEHDDHNEEEEHDKPEGEAGRVWREVRREIGQEIRREIGREMRREMADESGDAKRKNEDMIREGEKPKRRATPGRLVLSDDGELVEAVDIDTDTDDEDDVPLRRATRR